MRTNSEDLRQQLVYEYWLKRDTWLLRDEAVPLLLGHDPAQVEEGDPEITELWEGARLSVEEGELAVYNRQAPVDTWSVAPETIYRWAGNREISIPESFSALMEFILKTVKKDESVRIQDDNEAVSFNAGNEIILGAALAVVNAFPRACRKKDGSIDIRGTILQIHNHAETLFGSEDPGFTYERIYDLLKNWTGKFR